MEVVCCNYLVSESIITLYIMDKSNIQYKEIVYSILNNIDHKFNNLTYIFF